MTAGNVTINDRFAFITGGTVSINGDIPCAGHAAHVEPAVTLSHLIAASPNSVPDMRHGARGRTTLVFFLGGEGATSFSNV
eukprot:512373-Rhodomonas_salina.1